MENKDSQLPANRERHQLPTLAELYKDKDMVIKRSEVNVLLNQQPNKEWIRDHPIATKEINLPDGTKKEVPVAYIPIERLQWLMRRIFGKYTVHILEYRLIAHSVSCTVRLFYSDPLTGEQEYVDGIGATPLQTKKGAPAADFSNIKNNAVQIALPAAKTFAEKDAITSLGKIFGSDLNRFEEVVYQSQRQSFEILEFTKLRQEMAKYLGTNKNEKLVDKVVNEHAEKEENGTLTKEDYERWIKELKKPAPAPRKRSTTSSKSKQSK